MRTTMTIMKTCMLTALIAGCTAGAALLSALPPVVHVARGDTGVVECFELTRSSATSR